jgi:hypothetical protein
VTYDATLEGGALRLSGAAASAVVPAEPTGTPDSVSYGRADLGALATTSFGPVEASLRARGSGDLAAEGRRDGGDRAATARLRFGLPMVRAFGDEPGQGERANDPIVHVVDPFVSAAVLHARGNAILGALPGRGVASVSGTAPVTEAGVTSSVGTWASRQALEMTAAGGAAYGPRVTSGALRPLVRARLSGTLAWVGTEIDSAHVFAEPASGSVVLGVLRIGRVDGPRTYTHAAVRHGIDPTLARALTDPSIEAPTGFLAQEGVTGGTGLVIPWVPAVTTLAGIDVDATERQLVQARAGIELHDRCKCLTLRANGAHRIGRNGVDVWLALDFAPGR